MRWPLRNQIMLPMLGVMLGVIVAVSALNAYLSGRRAKQQIERQLQEVTQTLSESDFPLTEAVLRQMHGLSGAQFIVIDDSAHVIASIAGTEGLPLGAQPQQPDDITLGKPINVGGRPYFHAAVELHRRVPSDENVRLHILYPEQSYREAWREAVYPPLVIGSVALLFVVLLAVAIASRVARPLRGLQAQVGQIAKGDFRCMELPRRDDELRDLGESVNRMAELLRRYEQEVRQSERLRTLGQLGTGIAHQMRNSATGCRLAIELHARECRPGSKCDCLEVANRQITLMETQLKRFLSLGKPGTRQRAVVDLGKLVESTLPLLQPYARHVGVHLRWNGPVSPITTSGDPDALQQMLVNLLVNAIEAASRCSGTSPPSIGQAKVSIRLVPQGDDRVLLEVADSGVGPAETLQSGLFEPFVTDKPDGTGLGLSVAREIAEQHGGTIRWQRRDDMTCFTVELPLAFLETQRVEAARC